MVTETLRNILERMNLLVETSSFGGGTYGEK